MKNQFGKIILIGVSLSFFMLACDLMSTIGRIANTESNYETRRIVETQQNDDCNLTHYLGARIEITRDEVLDEERLCDFNLYFENQHKEEVGIPVLQQIYVDCYADVNEMEWILAPPVAPGKEGSWWGYYNVYKDPDCPSSVVMQKVLLAALVKDNERCRLKLEDQNYAASIAKTIDLDCPEP